MRPSLASPILIGYAALLVPDAALGRLIPLYHVIRAPPTGSPTSSPSYQPSARPSSHPTSSPSFSPSSSPSSRPSLRPSSRPTRSPSSSSSSKQAQTTGVSTTSTTSSFLTSEAMEKQPSFGTTFGFWEIISLSLVGILFCFAALGCNLVRKKRNNHVSTTDEDGDGQWWSSWVAEQLPSLWPGENSSDQQQPSNPPPPVEQKVEQKTKKQSTLPPAEEEGEGWSSWLPSYHWPAPPPVEKKKKPPLSRKDNDFRKNRRKEVSDDDSSRHSFSSGSYSYDSSRSDGASIQDSDSLVSMSSCSTVASRY